MMSAAHQDMAFYLVGFLSYPVMMAIVESVRRGR